MFDLSYLDRSRSRLSSAMPAPEGPCMQPLPPAPAALPSIGDCHP